MLSHSLPEESLAAVFNGARQPLELRRFPTPVPEAGEALVRIECCTICGSDLHTMSGARTERTPSILGHEAIGVVAEVGDPPPLDHSGHPLVRGQRVTWSVIAACGDCPRCDSGLPQKCLRLSKYGHELAEGRFALSGGLAECVLLRPGSTIIPISESIPAHVICPASCATATVAAAWRRCEAVGDMSGSSVLIFGAGMLGLTAAAWADHSGAAVVAVCDRDPQRLSYASAFGATHLIEWQAEEAELRERLRAECSTDDFDIVLELAGSPESVEAAIACGAVGSRVALVGSVMKSRPISTDPERIVRRCQSILGIHNYAPCDLVAAVNFLESCCDRYPFGELCQSSYTLTEVNRAVSDAMSSRPVRIAVQPLAEGSRDT